MTLGPSTQEQATDYDRIWDELAESNYQHQQHFKNRLFAIEWAVKRHPSVKPDILEVGCGFGTLAGILSNYGSVTANDLSTRAIEIAQERYPHVRFEAGDITDSSIVSGEYDILVTTEVIEHVPIGAKRSFVSALAERLRPGGTLILTTPNKTLSDPLEKFQLIEEHFTHDELTQALERNFDIEHITTVHRLFPVLGHSSRFFQALRWGIYEILRLRSLIESPGRISDNGLYFLVLAKRRT